MRFRALLGALVSPFLMTVISMTSITPAIAADGRQVTAALAGQTPALNDATVTLDGVSCGTNPAAFTALSWNVGVTNTQSSTGGGGGAGKAIFSDLVVQKTFDECTPRLFLLVATGQHITKLVLTQMDKTGRAALVVLLEDVLVSSYQLKDTETSASPAEQLNFNYAKLTITEPNSGTTSGPVSH